MKRLLRMIIIMTMLLLPFNAYAKEIEVNGKKYQYSNFKETLKEAGIEEKFTSYEETDNQVPIYLFRGDNCEYCKEFLYFLNDNAEEYGKYFKLVSFEIYSDNKNIKLMEKAAEFMNIKADGIPFVIIGNEYFKGYEDTYNEDIINVLTKTYETSVNERTDIFKSMNEDESLNKKISDDEKMLLWDLLFFVISIVFVIFYVNYKTNSLKKMLENDLDNKKRK
ncbi:MAG: hypothetical protein IJG68_00210 [Bacilli bacterium]|nr:hypothetical protein [Bacilli bacterium]